MPYSDPEKQREAQAKWARENYQRQKIEAENTRLKVAALQLEKLTQDKKIIELQKTINLMRTEHYPDLPLIKIGE